MNSEPKALCTGLLGSFDDDKGNRYAMLCNVFEHDERDDILVVSVLVKGALQVFQLNHRDVLKAERSPNEILEAMRGPPMFQALVAEARVFLR